jgi:hypothetical protein
MTRGNFLLWNKLHIVLRGFVMLMIITGLVGCAPSTATTPPPIICTPESPNVNIYRTAPQTLVEKIVQHVGSLIIPTPAAQVGTDPTSSFFNPSPDAVAQLGPQISEARYAAFQYLVDQTQRWSDSETIKLDDTNEAQITLTFLSPDLIQAAFLLSQILKDNFFTSDLQTQIQTVLNSIGDRDELLFLVTITATSSSGVPNSQQHSIKIPMDRMILTNTEDLLVLHLHEDHILDQPINTSANPVSGYIAFPLAMLTENGCKWILDPKYSTSIVITVPEITLDNAATGPYTWTIPYASLTQKVSPEIKLNFSPPDGFNTYPLNPIQRPPAPITSQMLQNGVNPNGYWEEFAKFVWNRITSGY